jgi:hypothetical protein
LLFHIAGADIHESRDEFNWFNSGKVGNVFHDETVAFALGTNPGVRFQMDVAVNAVKEGPGVRYIAWIQILASNVPRSAENWPGDSSL